MIGASKVARDISEQKRAQEALRESGERFRKLSETLDAQVRSRTRELQARTADVLHQAEQLRGLSGRLLQAQDEERRHIARELHDSAGQTLTVLGINLARLGSEIRVAPHLATQLQETEELVQRLNQDIRTTSYLLHPPLLDDSGLYSALTFYIQGIEKRSGLKIALDIPPSFERLPRDMELAIFRSVQESLTNVHRHSGSKTASIRVRRESGTITVEVHDQGKGMSPEKLGEIRSGGSGVGIKGCGNGCTSFKVTFNVESDGSGTRVDATLYPPAPPVSTPAEGKAMQSLKRAM